MKYFKAPGACHVVEWELHNTIDCTSTLTGQRHSGYMDLCVFNFKCLMIMQHSIEFSNV